MMVRTAMLAMGLAVSLSAAAWAAGASDMSVQIRNAQMRATPSYLGKPTGAAVYAERVRVLNTQGDWVQVQGTAGSGWLHKSALTTKKVVAKSGAADVGATASGEELALAGKGFNSDVESEFKKKNAKVDFAPIDRMEKIRVAPGEAREFLVDGGVRPTTGGAP